MRVRVYWNSHKGTFSVQGLFALPNGRRRWLVKDYTDKITLTDANFNVSLAGWQRMQRTGVKNVHAWIEGTVFDGEVGSDERIVYDSRRGPYFTTVPGQVVTTADVCQLVHPGDGHPYTYAGGCS